MTLKESYTYQNFLDKMIGECTNLLVNKKFITNTVEVHRLSDANPGTPNKTVQVKSDVDGDYTPMDVVNLYVRLIDEKDKLSAAISAVKKNTEIDIDKSMAMNKRRDSIISVLKFMDGIKPSETESYATAYRLNQTSGSQERFNYVVEHKSTINFDRNDVRNLIKKYKKLNDELSNKKDIIELTTYVDFNPKFDIDDSFEELVTA